MFSKKGKKGLSLLLMSGLVASSCVTPSDAAGKTTLAKKKMNLFVGESKKISIKNKKGKAKYTFSSSSKKKATVTPKGWVKAKKAGEATITVKEKYKGKSKSLGKVKVSIKNKNTNKKPAVTTPAITPLNGVKATEQPKETAAPTATATVSTTPKVTASSTPDVKVPSKYNSVIEENEGTIEYLQYDSTEVSEGETIKRKAKVVLPKGFSKEDKDKKYPVVYMIHGIFGNEEALVNNSEKTQNVIWNAMASGVAKEMIFIFPNACANKTGGSVGGNGGFNLEHYAAYDNFINDLTKCLMPYVNANYPVLTGRENTAICGFSMGGRVSLQIGFKIPEEIGYIGAFCPAFGLLPYDNNDVHEDGFYTEDTFALPADYMNNTMVLIAAGKNDGTVGKEPKRYHEALDKSSVPHLYYEVNAGHEKTSYQNGLYNFMRRIFKGTYDPMVTD